MTNERRTDLSKYRQQKGAVALSARDEPTLGGMPLLKSYIEFSGIHSDLFFASEGTASPNSTPALMTGRLRQVGSRAAGAAALIPSSARKRSGSSSRSFKAIFKRGMLHKLRIIPGVGCTDPFHIQRTQSRKNQRKSMILDQKEGAASAD